MNLKPELLSTLQGLGITPDELAMLYERMMSLVTALQAEKNALSAQIATLSAQRDEIDMRLASAYGTVTKLVEAQG